MQQRGFGVVARLCFVAVLSFGLGLQAQAITVKKYKIPTADSGPASLVVGPDGNIWFVETRGNNIGRITPNGVITEFALSGPNLSPQSIVAGPDGNLWFINRPSNNLNTLSRMVGRISLNGAITYFELRFGPLSIAAGKDGNLWFGPGPFTEAFAKMTTDGVITEYPAPAGGAGSYVPQMVAAPDGNIWYTRFGFSSTPFQMVGNITPDGRVTQTNLGDLRNRYALAGIGIGWDGNVWYTRSEPRFFTNQSDIGFVRATSNGSNSPSSIPTSYAPGSFTAGPYGDFWFGLNRVFLDGKETAYDLGSLGGGGGTILGPDKTMWLAAADSILQLTPDVPGDVVIARATNYRLGAVSPDSIAALFGNSLTVGTEGATTVPVPTTLAGISVILTDESGTIREAPLFYASPTQINFLVPRNTPIGNLIVTVVKADREIVKSGTVVISDIAGGLFSADQTGNGPAAAVVVRVKPNGSQIYESVVTRNASNELVPVPIDLTLAGDEVYLVLFGSGFGKFVDLTSVRAFGDDRRLEVLYAGAQGYYSGLDQANLRLTDSGLLSGERVIHVDIAGLGLNSVTIRIK